MITVGQALGRSIHASKQSVDAVFRMRWGRGKIVLKMHHCSGPSHASACQAKCLRDTMQPLKHLWVMGSVKPRPARPARVKDSLVSSAFLHGIRPELE